MFRSWIGAMLSVAVTSAALAEGASSALPADRVALARAFAQRGMHAEAVRELESVVGAKGVPGDEVAYRLGEEYRALGRTAEALKQSRILMTSYPQSRYWPYAQLAVARAMTNETRYVLFEQLDKKETPRAIRDVARYHLATYRARSTNPAERRRALAAYLDLASSTDERVAEEALYFAAMLGYRDQRYTEAAALFDRLFNMYPNSKRVEQARTYAAWANHLAGRPMACLTLAHKNPDDEDCSYLVALSLRTLEKRDAALIAFEHALKQWPNGRHKDALLSGRLELLIAKGDAKGILAALDVQGDIPQAYADRVYAAGCDAAARLGDWTRALEYARRGSVLTNSPYAARARYLTGAYSARIGKRDEAVRIWTELLVDAPDSPYAADALSARALEEIRLRNYVGANRSFQELARRFPNRATSAEILYWRGVAARATGDIAEADRLFVAALNAKPSVEFTREIQLERAYILQKKGDTAGSIRALTQILGTAVENRLPDAELVWLAENALKIKQYATAQKAAELVEKRSKDSSWKQIAAAIDGAALEQLGKNDAAIAAYRRALKQGAQTVRAAHAAYHLGVLLSQAGQHTEAVKHLTDAVTRASTPELAGLRMGAYIALAKDHDACGLTKEALGYYMLVSTLFDDPQAVPPAMTRAAELLRKQGHAREADELLAERKKRYDR